MLLVKKCEFNIDNNTVDIITADGTEIFIDCDIVEDEFGLTVRHRASLIICSIIIRLIMLISY